ncbi:class I SAM-dependent methyltransferase [Streptomyces sp. NPDC060064]|uniref:class I SAM-dependent methyltransferase n=1 Tax=Streptomyces sp. NPDC060064 TaxID=3347049 RepID=UPI00369554F2
MAAQETPTAYVGGTGDMAASRMRYQSEMSIGVDRFLEPRNTECPWCNSAALKVLLRSPDVVQHKPGRFTLEECGGCGHVFQNPRLTPEGLEFYYRDCYDGYQEALRERMFKLQAATYRGRIAFLDRHASPKAWLDVGAGHGHFCRAARAHWPNAVFDGLDFGDGVDKGVRRGWIDRSHRGPFPDLADDLTGRYDVVSMHHYLEHTLDPFAELDAAARVLPPGGHLLIEVPDPEWPLSRVLGRRWNPWCQPQHLHMFPIGNLKEALRNRGLDPVAEERGMAHQTGADLLMAMVQFWNALMPDPDAPWLPRRGTGYRMSRKAALVAKAPSLALAGFLDVLILLAARSANRGNAYRVLARKAP